MVDSPTQQKARLAEVVASLSLATDLATGQPLEHGLRRTLLAIWLGEELGLDAEDLSTTYYVALLGTVGCVLDGSALSGFLKDEIDVRSKMVTLDPTDRLGLAAFFLREAGSGDPPWQRLKKVVSLSRQSQNVCRDVALHVGGLLDLGPAVREALGQCDEPWNGKGGMLGLKGEDIHIASRLFMLCHDVEVFNRIGGVDTAMSVVKRRSGKLYDPRMAERFGQVGPGLLERLQSVPAWDTVLAAEPEPVSFLAEAEFDDVACKVANFIDIRSPYTLGHSAGVASLAQGAARELRLSSAEALALRQAGLLHDLGRAGVPVSAWNKKTALATEDWERMKRHPSLTELVLARSSSLGHLGTLAGLHHERLDGSGYRGMSAASLSVAARILAVADAYRTKLEPRPHREALRPERAADHLRREADQGKLDPECVQAVLAAGGLTPQRRKRELPAGLSEREAEVLRLAVRGMSNRQIADALFLSPKTVGHHLESIYSKIDVSTRAGAAVFAVQHGLVEDTVSL